MYAHQVIEDLENMRYQTGNRRSELYKDLGLRAASRIKSAQKFHLGAGFEYYGFIDLAGGKRPFLEDMGECVRLPYKVCWFDYTSTGGRKKQGGQVNVPKRGVLAMEFKEDLLHLSLFSFIPKNENAGVSGWFLNPIYYFVSVGAAFAKRKDWEDIKPLFVNSDPSLFDTLNICPLSHFDRLDVKADSALEEDIDEIGLVNIALMLLSSKNIGTEEVKPAEKLNKARAKRGKKPLYTYHTLVIKPTGKRQESIPRHLWNNRIHLCRGHFKRYTADAPLFGKHVGLYWWEPAVRGDKKQGIVQKDYKIEPRCDETLGSGRVMGPSRRPKA